MTFCSAGVTEEPNWGRGPVQVTDLFPLSFGRLNSSPSSPEIAREGQSTLRTTLHWANTINGATGKYLIDAESRELLLASRIGVGHNLEVGVQLPILWRGSGVMDSFIYDWHQFWGFPQGPRQGTEKDRFDVSGSTQDGSKFDYDSRGVKLGDLRFSAKKLFSKGTDRLPALAGELSVRVPTGNTDYSPGGVDILGNAYLSKKLGAVYLYSGFFSSWYQNKVYNDISYEAFRYGADIGVECPITKTYSLLFNISGSSNYTSDIVNFPKYQIYADMGLKYDLSVSSQLEILIRENPAPDTGSSDFSFLLGLKSRLTII